MAYQTGTETSMNNLIGTVLPAFAVANGWTVHVNTWPTLLILSKNGCFAVMQKLSHTVTNVSNTLDERILGQLATSFNASAPTFGNQPGTVTTTVPSLTSSGATSRPSLPDGIVVSVDWRPRAASYVAYHMYETGNAIYIFLENLVGDFTQFGFGLLDKKGATYNVGQFMIGNETDFLGSNDTRGNYSNTNRFPLFESGSDNRTGAFHFGNAMTEPRRTCRGQSPFGGIMPLVQSHSAAYPAGSSAGRMYTYMFLNGATPINGATPFYPIPVYCSRNAGDTFPVSYMGELPGLRYCSMQGRASGELVTITPDTWRIFPHRRTQTSTLVVGQDNSHFAGYAIKES